MRQTLDVYRRLISVSIRSQMQYRAGFFFDLIGTGISTGTVFLTLALILERFQHVAGWTLWEIALLYGTVETAFGVMDMVFGGFDPSFFGQQVRKGTFDRILLRPASVTWQVLGSEFTLRRLARIFQGGLALVLALIYAGVRWTLLKALLLPVTLASLVLFFGALFMVGATITFWTVQSIEVVNIFTYGGVEMMSYPMSIYSPWLRRFFTYIIPGIFMNYYPALYILDKPDPLGFPAWTPLLCPLVGAAMLALALAFWRFGIRHYTSTGT